MQRDTFKIDRPEDRMDDRMLMPARSFMVEAKEYVPDNRARAVRIIITQEPSAMSGHTFVKADFALSPQERRDLVAFLAALPDHND